MKKREREREREKKKKEKERESSRGDVNRNDTFYKSQVIHVRKIITLTCRWREAA